MDTCFHGLFKAWRRMQEQLPQIVSPKAERAIKAMETALDDFPLLDPKVPLLLRSMPEKPVKCAPEGPCHLLYWP